MLHNWNCACICSRKMTILMLMLLLMILYVFQLNMFLEHEIIYMRSQIIWKNSFLGRKSWLMHCKNYTETFSILWPSNKNYCFIYFYLNSKINHFVKFWKMYERFLEYWVIRKRLLYMFAPDYYTLLKITKNLSFL